ncbi:MAG: hypothetical protein LPK26_08895 [Bacillaceae bacterium]|nr:hypothetical protein [Bacillaceae bacterium]
MELIIGDQKGNLIIEKDTKIIGSVIGDIKVLGGAKLNLDAKVNGDLYLNKNSIAYIKGSISGNIYNYGSSIEFLNSDLNGKVIKPFST